MKTFIYKLVIVASLALAICVPGAKASDYKSLISLAGYWKFNLGDDKKWADDKVDDKNWDNVRVPGSWESQGYVGYDGFAWYRKKIVIPSFNDDRTVTMILSNIDDADEVYINGHLIGSTGNFPPKYASAYDWSRRYYIPQDFINKDKENLIAIRVYDDGGEGGIMGDRIKIYTDADEDLLNLNLAGKWKFKLFDKKAWRDKNFDDSKWNDIWVPMSWESQGYFNHDGYAWYRKNFILPGYLENDKLYLILGKIDDYDEVFVNGEKVGETSNLPGHSGFFNDSWWGNGNDYNLNRAYQVRKGLLKKGENVIAIRVYDAQQQGGIYEGPIGIMNEKNYRTYESKHHLDDNVFQTIFDFIFE
jgi:sialate O-acetylesterase